MTLHWWMHWFWVTLWFAVVTGIPLSSRIVNSTTTTTTEIIPITAAKGEDDKRPSIVTVEDSFSSSPSPIPLTSTKILLPSTSILSSSPSKQNLRTPKAIAGIEPVLSLPKVGVRGNLTIFKNDYRVDRDAKIDDQKSVLKLGEEGALSSTFVNFDNGNKTSSISNSNKSLSLLKHNDSVITWISNGNNRTLINEGGSQRNSSSDNVKDDIDPLAVLPLHEPIPKNRFKLVLNRTKFIPSTNVNDDNNKLLNNKSEDIEIIEDVVESRLLATAASILQGVSESPRLSRARSSFPGDYQQDEQQEQRQEKPAEIAFSNATSSAIDIATVTGSCLATLVLIGTMGSLGFVMYRRRYLNPPQTLNSDKCSNPDSSGYIDDSTIRDNSEEMYSLDNDSFLNSLEAMTIQNYWTDSVKHTKL